MMAEIERVAQLANGRAQEIVDALAPWLISENMIADMHQPLLVFRHDGDFVSPARGVNALFEDAAGPKEMVSFGDLGHAAGQFERTALYAAHLAAFLDKVWLVP
jgi:hypothetical protein